MLEFPVDYNFFNSNRPLLIAYLLLLGSILLVLILFSPEVYYYLFFISYFIFGLGILFFLNLKLRDKKIKISLEEYEIKLSNTLEIIKIPYNEIVGSKRIDFYFNFEVAFKVKEIFGSNIKIINSFVTTIPNIIIYSINKENKEKKIFLLSLENPEKFISALESLLPKQK